MLSEKLLPVENRSRMSGGKVVDGQNENILQTHIINIIIDSVRN